VGDVVIDPGKVGRFAFQTIRVLGKSIAYESSSKNNCRAFHSLLLRYKA
jgi:hypothetical protein